MSGSLVVVISLTASIAGRLAANFSRFSPQPC